jgi:hypothetical protein
VNLPAWSVAQKGPEAIADHRRARRRGLLPRTASRKRIVCLPSGPIPEAVKVKAIIGGVDLKFEVDTPKDPNADPLGGSAATSTLSRC